MSLLLPDLFPEFQGVFKRFQHFVAQQRDRKRPRVTARKMRSPQIFVKKHAGKNAELPWGFIVVYVHDMML